MSVRVAAPIAATIATLGTDGPHSRPGLGERHPTPSASVATIFCMVMVYISGTLGPVGKFAVAVLMGVVSAATVVGWVVAVAGKRTN